MFFIRLEICAANQVNAVRDRRKYGVQAFSDRFRAAGKIDFEGRLSVAKELPLGLSQVIRLALTNQNQASTVC